MGNTPKAKTKADEKGTTAEEKATTAAERLRVAAAEKAVRDNRALAERILAKLMGTKLQLDELVKETRLKDAKDAHVQLINEESESINEIYASAQKNN